MLFNTVEFLIFFAVTILFSHFLPHRPRLYFLLLASYFFYGYWRWEYTGLLLLSTLIDYFAALQIARSKDQARRRLFLIASLVSNLSLLGAFKYYNFFAQSLLPWAGWRPPLLEVLLPVGISFYTFQSMSYTIDVYRGVLEPRKSFVDFALFVSFFPQLVAGPIVRAKDFLYQLDAKPPIHWDRIRSGAHLVVRGLIEKVVIADNLAPIVERVYGNPSAYHGSDFWIATYCFAFQIFCDFAGYTDIARGCARILGYEFLENFKNPYLAQNITDFWRRWHISLSTWLRDYLYIPLGGSRGNRLQTYRNLFLTMLLGGLWHGANWTFLWWGFYQGVLLMLHRAYGQWRQKTPAPPSILVRILQIFVTFHMVCIGWVLFRAENMSVAMRILYAMFDFPFDLTVFLPYLILSALLFAAMAIHEFLNPGRIFERLPLPARTFILLMALLSVSIFSPTRKFAFIYFQF